MENFRKLVKPISNADVVSLTGFGETFLVQHLDQMLEFIFENNPREHIISIITNGTLLSKEWGHLLRNRVHSMVISFNAATEESYKKFVKASFSKTVRGISEFMESLDEADRQRITFTNVVHHGNMHEMTTCVDMVKQFGGKQIGFHQYQVNKVENIPSSIWFRQEEYNSCLNAARERGAALGIGVNGVRFGDSANVAPAEFDPQNCQSPFREVIVNIDGRIVPCCFAGHYMGNAYEQDFDEIWFGPEYEKLRNVRHLKACRTCQSSVPFDDFKAHIAPDLKLRKGEEVARVFQETQEQIQLQRDSQVVDHIDIDLYEARRGEFGAEYQQKLDSWKQAGGLSDREQVDEIYRAKGFAALPAARRAEIDLGGTFYGTAWGKPGSNMLGQSWRWLLPHRGNEVLVNLAGNQGWMVETLIHTAHGESLWNLRVAACGQDLAEQRIVRKGNTFWHRALLPRSVVASCGGKVRLTYWANDPGTAEGTDEAHLVALSKVKVIPVSIRKRMRGVATWMKRIFRPIRRS